jgi:protein SCO1
LKTALAALLLVAAVSAAAAPRPIPDVAVVDQSGRSLRFYRDLIEKKVVVLAFFYTQCRGACPIVGRTLHELQNALGARLGREVFLVSVTMDPSTDTPERLEEWGRSYGVKAGWTLVTGEPAVIEGLVRELTGEGRRPSLHVPALYILNDRTGEWVRDKGNAAPDRYTKTIDAMLRRERER